MEIERLHKMLLEAGIEHEWRDRTPPGYEPKMFSEKIVWGWQIIVYYPDGERMISAIEGFGTYGYGRHGIPAEDGDDLIEIMSLLTPEEEEYERVVGFLTAEDVFQRIVRAVNDD